MPWREPPTTSRLVLAWRIALLIAPPMLLVAVGVISALYPPPSVEAADSPISSFAWSASMVLGGLCTMVGMVWRRLEGTHMAGLALIAGGSGYYSLHLLDVGVTGLTAAGLVGALALASVGELYRLADVRRFRHRDYDRSRRQHPAHAGRRG